MPKTHPASRSQTPGRGLSDHRRRLAPYLADPASRPSRMFEMLLEHRELPKLWGLLGLDLKHAADILWIRGASSVVGHSEQIAVQTGGEAMPDADPPEDTLVQAQALLDTAKMLLGLAFENLVKGIVVAREPALVKDGIPSPKLVSHQVADLARTQGLLETDGEYRLLKVLEQYVIWLGRYPLPREKESYHDLIGVDIGEDPLELDKTALDALFDRLVHHPDMRWDP